jgi:hypothetical protein
LRSPLQRWQSALHRVEAPRSERRLDMITEIITFGIPGGMTRDQVVANYRRSAPSWRANPDLIRKNYLYDAKSRRAGGVYLWRTLEAAQRARNDAWLERVRATYGSEPVVQYFETPLVADNALGEIIDEGTGVTRSDR